MNNIQVAVFAYNRPKHLQKTLEALRNNHGAEFIQLYIFCDGPKAQALAQDLALIAEVQSMSKQQRWCKQLEVICSPTNKGLTKSIVEGVTQLMTKHERVVALEDDHVTSPWFLTFMNDALNKYEGDERVACISGYIYPVASPLPSTFFITGADCWGWATWKRAWHLYRDDAQKLYQEIISAGRVSEFNFHDTYPYMQMLRDRAEGKNNSWAVCWYASTFLQNKLTLYPGHSLVQNIGNDNSGVHSASSNAWDVQLYPSRIEVLDIPLKEQAEAKSIIAEYFANSLSGNSGFIARMRRKIKRTLSNK